MKFPLFNMNLFIEDLKKKKHIGGLYIFTRELPVTHVWVALHGTWLMQLLLSLAVSLLTHTHTCTEKKKKESYLHAELVCTPAL